MKESFVTVEVSCHACALNTSIRVVKGTVECEIYLETHVLLLVKIDEKFSAIWVIDSIGFDAIKSNIWI